MPPPCSSRARSNSSFRCPGAALSFVSKQKSAPSSRAVWNLEASLRASKPPPGLEKSVTYILLAPSVRPTAEYGHGLPRDISLHNRVHAVAERVEEGPEPGRDDFGAAEAIEVDDVFAGHDDVLGERAVEVDAFDPDVLADVALPGAALLAVAAADVHLARDVIAHPGDRRVHVFSDLGDFTAELVADDDRPVSGDLAAVVTEHLVA